VAKKKTKSLLPKRIGGVKVPKALRKGRAGRFLTSPAGVAVLTEAFALAGAVGAVRKADPDSRVGRLRESAEAEMKSWTAAAEARGEHSAEQLKAAFAAASAAFADALRSGADAIEPASKKVARVGEPRAAH
jgi:hypothetical protein